MPSRNWWRQRRSSAEGGIMAENKLLILRLEGVLQSWDDTSKWDERGTGDYPTKSGIVGLLGCALGLQRGSPELADLSAALTMAVRADRPGERIVDFQTVTGDPLLNADGKPKTTGNTIISRRAYLQDACFTVFLETDTVWHERLAEALKTPQWPVFLGRKACVPSRPVLECASPAYSDITEALYSYPSADRAVFPMLYETELPNEALSTVDRPDNLVGADRRFVRRRVWRGLIKEITPCI